MGLRVHQCCCGCSLRTGTISIAVCHIVISSVVLTFVPMLLYRIYNPVDQHTDSRNNTDDEGGGVEKDEEEEEKNRKSHEILIEGVTGLYITLIVAFSCNLIINMLLIIGAYKEKPLLVNIWIIVNSVFFMACVVVTVLGIFMLFVEWKLALLSMKSCTLCAVVTAYCIVVVNSFYHQLDHRQIAPCDDKISPIVFVIDPPPPPPPDPPPPPYQKHL